MYTIHNNTGEPSTKSFQMYSWENYAATETPGDNSQINSPMFHTYFDQYFALALPHVPLILFICMVASFGCTKLYI